MRRGNIFIQIGVVEVELRERFEETKFDLGLE